MTAMPVPEGRILVTGAAGFIGSALVWALNSAGHDDIIVADRLDSGDRFRNLVPLRFRDYIEADDLLELIEARGLQALGPVRTVIHLGACSSTTEKDCAYLLRNNYEYTKRLAAVCLSENNRFVYASSAATYGGREDVLDDRVELTRLRPLNMYAYSKQLFDVYAQRQGWLERCAGVKYFNVFGPNEGHKGDMRSVIAKAYDTLQTRDDMALFKSYRAEYADGEQRRDFIYVKDAVRATLYLATQHQANGIFNIGSGRAATWNELMTHVFAALQKPLRITYIEMPEYLKSAYQYSTIAGLERLRDAGYDAPMTELGAAIREYVGYLQAGQKLDPQMLSAV